jgi:uncharacterized membrane protein
MKKIYVYIKKIEPYLCKSCNEAPKQHRSRSLRAIYIYIYIYIIFIFIFILFYFILFYSNLFFKQQDVM